MCIVLISLGFSKLEFPPVVLEHTPLQSHLLWGEFNIWALCYCCTQSLIAPPGTHHCWVGRDSMEWEVCPTLLYMTSGINQTSDVESNVLSTEPHASIYIFWAANFGTIFYLLVYILLLKLDKKPLMLKYTTQARDKQTLVFWSCYISDKIKWHCTMTLCRHVIYHTNNRISLVSHFEIIEVIETKMLRPFLVIIWRIIIKNITNGKGMDYWTNNCRTIWAYIIGKGIVMVSYHTVHLHLFLVSLHYFITKLHCLQLFRFNL